MWTYIRFGLILATVLPSIEADFRNPYQPVAALFGPKNKFLCNALVLTQGRVLTTADCLFMQHNKTYILGKPEDFHVALETHSIEQFQNGKAFGKGSKWKYLEKLKQKFGVKHDNKYGNGVLSDQLKPSEETYLLKALRSADIKPPLRNSYVPVLKVTIHPMFKAPFRNDLAVLDIPDSYPTNKSSIVALSDLDLESAYNRAVHVHGFGILSHGANETNRTAYFKLRTVEMLLLPPVHCQRVVGDLFELDHHLCLLPQSNETLCFGFTGAPIVLDGKLMGIVEFGHFSCSLSSPVVGTRLDMFRGFLGVWPPGFLERIRAVVRNLMGLVNIVRS